MDLEQEITRLDGGAPEEFVGGVTRWCGGCAKRVTKMPPSGCGGYAGRSLPPGRLTGSPPRSPICSTSWARPLGVFWMTDEKGPDAKIIAVVDGDPDCAQVRQLDDLPSHLQDEIEHFFDIYKDLEPGKSSSTAGFEGLQAAHQQIAEARARAR